MASESIIVRLGLDNSAFNRGLTGAKQSVDKMKASWGQITGAFMVAGLARKAFDMADSIQRLQVNTGLAAETVQALLLATEQAGGIAEMAEKNLNKFSENVGKARVEGGEAAKVFKLLGIEIDDSTGKARSNEAILRDLADRFENIKDPAERAAKSVELFGKGGFILASVLAQGNRELDELKANLIATGAIMSEQTVRELDAIDDAFKHGATSASNWVGRIIGGVSLVAKSVGALTKTMATGIGGNQTLQEMIDGFMVDFDKILLGDKKMESANLAVADSLKKRNEAMKEAAARMKEMAKAQEKMASTFDKWQDANIDFRNAKRDPALFGSLQELASADVSRGATPRMLAEMANARSIMGQEANAERLKQAGLTDLAEQGFELARKRRGSLTMLTADARNPLRKQEEYLEEMLREMKAANVELKKGPTVAGETEYE